MTPNTGQYTAFSPFCCKADGKSIYIPEHSEYFHGFPVFGPEHSFFLTQPICFRSAAQPQHHFLFSNQFSNFFLSITLVTLSASGVIAPNKNCSATDFCRLERQPLLARLLMKSGLVCNKYQADLHGPLLTLVGLIIVRSPSVTYLDYLRCSQCQPLHLLTNKRLTSYIQFTSQEELVIWPSKHLVNLILDILYVDQASCESWCFTE